MTSAAQPAVHERDFVTSLARGLEVLRAFGADTPVMTLSEVAARTGLTRAGARRFLLTLVELGYVYKNGRQFRLTPKVLALGYAYLSSMPLPQQAQPFLEEITAATNESCSLAVLDGADIVYLARSPARRILMVGIQVGTRLPAHATSMGRVLLADLEPPDLDRYLRATRLERRTRHTLTDPERLESELARVRRQNYAIIDQELEEGVRSIAVPVRDPGSGRVVAAINISTNVAAVPKERLVKEFLPVLQGAAARISAGIPR